MISLCSGDNLHIRPEHRVLKWYAYVLPTLETFGSITIKRPQDYNVLQRLVGIKRSEDTKFLNDYEIFVLCSTMAQKFLLSAILAGILTVFTTLCCIHLISQEQ